MNKNFERELPEGYREVFSVDAKTKKTVIIMNITALCISLALLLIPLLWMGIPPFTPQSGLTFMLVFLCTVIIYMVLHELVHGIAYKLLTGEKLKFGLTATVAYCGVPDIYVYRKTALISLLAPFTVFGVLFLVGMIVFWGGFIGYLCGFLFAVHCGGCVGDLYDTFLYLTRFRDPLTLMRDTGPKQTFYLPDQADNK